MTRDELKDIRNVSKDTIALRFKPGALHQYAEWKQTVTPEVAVALTTTLLALTWCVCEPEPPVNCHCWACENRKRVESVTLRRSAEAIP